MAKTPKKFTKRQKKQNTPAIIPDKPKRAQGIIRCKEKNLLIRERYEKFRAHIINRNVGALGTVLAIGAKVLLQQAGFEVDFKINGQNISEIKKLKEIDIEEKLRIAIAEERYEDAAKLKQILTQKLMGNNEKRS